MTKNERAYRSYRMSGTVFIALGVIFLAATALAAYAGEGFGGFVLGIVALILGKFGFDHFENSVEFAPQEAYDQFVHELIVFPIGLQGGGELKIGLQVQYESVKDNRKTLDRIEVQLQSTLNDYFLSRAQLSDDPFREINELVANAISPLERSLGLQGLKIKTVEVKPPNSPPRSAGNYVGYTKP